MQDEILTHLAKIADLKVISRTSRYAIQERPPAQPARDQAATGRRPFVGGQRAARGQPRAGKRAADRRAHRRASWAQTYDRDLADVFAIQSEIAKAIADQLQARLSPNRESGD